MINLIGFAKLGNNHADIQDRALISATISAFESFYGSDAHVSGINSISDLKSNIKRQVSHYEKVVCFFSGPNGILAINDIHLFNIDTSCVQCVWIGDQLYPGWDIMPSSYRIIPSYLMHDCKDEPRLESDDSVLMIPCLPKHEPSFPENTKMYATNFFGQAARWRHSLFTPPSIPNTQLHSNSILNQMMTFGQSMWSHARSSQKSKLGKEIIWILPGDNFDAKRQEWSLFEGVHALTILQTIVNGLNDLRSFATVDKVDKVNIINGPRTCSKIPDFFGGTNYDDTVFHKSPASHFSDDSIDPVTKATKHAALRSFPNADIEVHHYYTTDDTIHCGSEAAIHSFLIQPQAILILPGDCPVYISNIITSQIFQTNKDRVFIATTPSMTTDLEIWVKQLYNEGYFGLVDMQSARLLPAKDQYPDVLCPINTIKEAISEDNECKQSLKIETA